MSLNPYHNNQLIYNLDDSEIELLDNVWKFIGDFRITKISRTKYREYIVNKIKNKYDIEQFYNFEIIVEKLYWNLLYKLRYDIDFSPEVFIKQEYNLEDTTNKILMRNKNIKESNIRKTYVVTKNNNLLYKYDYPNSIDLLMSSIIINRTLYETIMINYNSINEFDLKPYNNTIEFDYPFPNLNTIKGFTKSYEERIENIIKMYYVENAEKNWFSL